MKLQEGRWYADHEGNVRGPMVKLPKDDSRRGGGMRFGCGVMTWGKDGHFEIIGVPSSFDVIREAPAPSECHPDDNRAPPPGYGESTIRDRAVQAARLTPVGQIGALPYSSEFTQLPTAQQASYGDWPFEVPSRTVGQPTAAPADPMAELCQSIVTDAANAAQAIRDKAVQDAPEPASDDARVAPPLVPKAIKRKKWGDWIEGPVDVWWNGRKVQAEVVPAVLGVKVIRHRIKSPRE